MKITTREQAAVIAEKLLDREIRPNLAEEVAITEIREYPTCWLAGFNTVAYIETGEILHALAGGGPIINRPTGVARFGTSALPAGDQLDPE
ncbi:MAG TPA: YrhB domain-containing protein [Acidimicrobiales bacterium]|nr:YrhB domain-containing protein [Acidimicrobiales bacterium]